MIVLTTLKQKATAATIQILKCCGLSLLLTGLPYYLENLFDQFSKVLLAVDKLHTVLQSTLDCRLSLGGLNQIQKMFYKWFIFSLLHYTRDSQMHVLGDLICILMKKGCILPNTQIMRYLKQFM